MNAKVINKKLKNYNFEFNLDKPKVDAKKY